MAFRDDISDRQLALLCDLLALQRAGMIEADSTSIVSASYDGGIFDVSIPATVTWKGEKAVNEFVKSGKVIAL